MVKKIKIILFTFISAFSFFSCQSSDHIKRKTLKHVKNFSEKDFPNISFSKLYILEGIYETKSKLELYLLN